jgi:hypothetical protein
MKRTLLIMLVAGLVTMMAASMASAGVVLTEDWESYVSGTTPYDSWTLGNGTWMGLVPGVGQAKGTQAYTISPVGTSRIAKAHGADLSKADKVILEGYFYDTNGASSMKRTWLGLQNGIAVDGALLRIGMNNLATYQVHYYDGALKVVNTGVSNATGWHYVKLTNTKSGSLWQTDWVLDSASGSFTWAWAADKAKNVVLGYNYSCTNEVNWDDIKLTTVPEPGSMLALGTGLLGLFGFIRRRRA